MKIPLFVLICVAFAVNALQAQSFLETPTNAVLQSWSFYNSLNWTNDSGYAPLSFTNISISTLGNGQSLVVDTNIPAWLRYNVVESDGTTNLTLQNGTVTFWVAPGSWSSTNLGGSGPGENGRLLEVGAYTTNSSYGLWSIYLDSGGNHIYFSAQTNDLSSNLTTYVSAPISWTNDYFHFVALTYSATNTTLYLDGVEVTNGAGVTVFPGHNVLTNGFCIGSDTNGIYQAHGLFDTVYSYNYPLDSNDIWINFQWELSYNNYMIDPLNVAMDGSISDATSSPSYTPQFDVISGQGNLAYDGAASNCVDGSSAYDVWITNVVARISVSNSNIVNLSFTIEGGSNNVPYDVFANNVLSFGTNGSPWSWMGQGYQCETYTLSILSNSVCFLILGTPQDTSGFGLTDAYEDLVMKVNPGGSQTDTNGVPYAWYAEQGLTPYEAGMGGQDPDHDGLLNYQEYEYGTRPLVNEGFSIWVSQPGTASELP